MSTKNFFVKDGLKVKGNTLLNGANYNDTALAKLHVKSAANGVSANLNNVNGLIVENSGTSDSNYIFKLATGSGNIFNITNSGKVGVGTTSPVENLTVVGNISASGSIYGNVEDVTMELENLEVENFTVTGATCLNTLSVSGDSTLASVTATELVLSGDVEADEFIGNLRGAVSFTAKASGALTKGDAVYIAGISGNTTVVDKADADDASKMPAFGIASETVNANASVTIINFGAVTNLDTSSYVEGTELYVSTTAGQLTNTAPTGEGSLLQKIAKVTRQDNAAGSITVMGAGRTNAVPNLNQGSIFVGNSSNQAVADNSVYVKIGSNPRIGIGTTNPATDLHIYSETAASRSIRVTSCDGAGSLYFGDCTDPSKAGFTVGQYARTMTLVAGCCSLVTLNNTNDCKWVGVGTASPNAPLHVYTDSAVSETVAKFEKGLGDSTLTISSTCLGIKLKSTGCSTINVDSTCLAIGTNSPTALLDVRGTTNISGTVGIGTTSACAAAKLHVNRDDTVRTDVILENNDNTANAELASIQYRGLDNGNASQLYAQIVGLVDDPTAGSEQGRLSFETVTSGSVSPRMTIDGSNVGIGTCSPNEKLTVVGNISATGSIYGNIEDVSLNLTLSEGTLFVGNSANTATEDSTIFVDTANSRVGIGTTSPDTTLHVNGSIAAGWDRGILLSQEGTNIGRIIPDNEGIKYRTAVSGDDHWFRNSANTTNLIIKDGGNVGIGTTDPNEKLTVSGNISASGTVYADAFNSTTGGSAISFNDDVTLAGSLTATNICATSNITNCGNIVSCGNVIQTAGCVIACTCVQTPQVLGTKISVGSLNAGYDFYNNGTSYLNGATTIDDTVTISCHICMAGGSGSRLYFNGIRWAEGSTSGGGQLTLAEDYTLAQFRSSLCVCNDLTVAGNFTVHGTTTTLNTTVTATSAMCICNAGTGPALELNQTGTQPVIDLQDDGTSVFYIEDGGYVGIGTTNPDGQLHVKSSSSGTYTIKGESSAGNPLGGLYDASSGAQFYLKIPNGTNTVKFSSYDDSFLNGGNVGIGTTSPLAKLHVSAGSQDGILIDANNALLGKKSTDNTYTQLMYWNGDVVYYGRNTTAPASHTVCQHQFRTGGTTRLTLTTSEAIFNDGGNNYDFRVEGDTDTDLFFVDASTDRVGIGTTSPGTKLHIDSGSGIGTVDNAYSLAIRGDGIDGIQILSDSAYSGRIVFGDQNSNTSGQIRYDHSTDAFRLYTNGTEKVSILSGGNVGIGTDDPTNLLTVNGGTESIGVQISNTPRLTIGADGTWNYFKGKSGQGHYFNTSGGAIFVIQNGGNVGVGTASPNEKLTVSGNISASGVIYGDTFCSNSGSSSTIDFNDNLDIDGYITASDYIETTNTSTTSAMVMGFKDQFKRTYTTEYSFTQNGAGLHTFNLGFPSQAAGVGWKYKAVLIIQRQGSAYTFGSIEDNSYIYREIDNDFTHRSEDQVLVSSGLGSSNSVVLSGDITSFNTDYVTSSTLSGTSTYDYYVVRYPLDFNYNFSGTNKIMVHLETYNYSGPDPVFTIA